MATYNFLIPLENQEKFCARMNKLMMMGEKLGIEVSIQFGDAIDVPVNEAKVIGAIDEKVRRAIFDNGCSEVVPHVQFEVTCGDIKLPGNHQLVAISLPLDDKDQTNTFRVFNGSTIPEEFRHLGMTCQHCNVFRHRKHVVILKDDQGKHVQVGRGCLREFLGVDVEQMLRFCESLQGKIEKKLPQYSAKRTLQTVSTKMLTFLTTAVCIDEGFIGKKAADWNGKEPTYAKVQRLMHELYASSPFVGDKYITKYGLNDEGRLAKIEEKHAEYKAMLASLDPSVGGYTAEVFHTASKERIPHYNVNLLISGWSFMKRAQQKVVEVAKTSEWIGKEGDKVTFIATLDSITTMSNKYSPAAMYMHKFTGEKGEAVTWFTTKNFKRLLGQKVKVEATVKKTDTYRGNKQTTITRAAVSEMVAA